MSKSHIWAATVAVAFAATSMPAVADFSGPYSVINWATAHSPGDGGSVNTGGAPGSIELVSSNLALADPLDSWVEFTVAAAGSGSFSFDWSYHSHDAGTGGNEPAFWDPAFVVHNGALTLSDDTGARDQTGHVSLTVAAGDTIGFRIQSRDNYGADGIFTGEATLTITNFSAPVPEPGSAILLALGLTAVGGAAARRRLLRA